MSFLPSFPRFVLGLSAIFVLSNCHDSNRPSAATLFELPQVPTPEVETTEGPSNPIVLGDISDKPARVVENFQPLANYLAANLSEYGITEGQVKVAPDLITMTKWMAQGEVDLYFDSAYPALQVSTETGAIPILRRWKKGVSGYYSVFFTLAESNIQSLANLRGQLIAFDSPYSTSGYMLPVVTLLEAGLTPSLQESPDAIIDTEKVGYIFSSDDDNTLLWVLEGEVTAGVVDSETFSKLTEEGQDNLRVLFETEAVPRHVAVAAADLDPAMVDTLKTIMVDMNESKEGAKVLQNFEKTAQFDEFPEPNELNRLKELFQKASDIHSF